MSLFKNLMGNRPADSAIRKAIDARAVSVVFQPIVDLATNRIFAYEALARSQTPDFKGPLPLFQAAVEEKLVGELGRLLRQMAIDGCPGATLFLNVNPNEFGEGWLVRPDDPLFWHGEQVYLEITESVPISHFTFCTSVLREIRGKGVRLAIDDFGAGYSNIKYISELEPEIVKLDMELVQGLAGNKRQRQLVRSLVRLCSDMNAKVVAEGIETAADLDEVRAAGVHLAQGYFLARPAFPPPTTLFAAPPVAP